MGNLASSARRHGDERADGELGFPVEYPYPAKTGPFFGSHFLMGGDRFELTAPEAYLFGENQDLNFLSQRAVTLPYVRAHGTEPTRAVCCLVNVRRDSIKLVRVRSNDSQSVPNEESFKYHVEFVLDCDVACRVTIQYMVRELIDPATGLLTYVSAIDNPSGLAPCSETYRFGVGAGQQFRQPAHVFDPSALDASRFGRICGGVVPVVIHCASDADGAQSAQSHATLAVVEESAEGGFVLKPVKQKFSVNGVSYLLHEIFGIENKHSAAKQPADDSAAAAAFLGDDSNSADCVVCLSVLRDTIILPCRHLCLCYGCAENLRYKASNCPICRSPFRALLHLKTLRRLGGGASAASLLGRRDDSAPSGRGVGGLLATRYESVPLVEALNGPVDHTQTCYSLPPPRLPTSQSAPEITAHDGTSSPPQVPPRGRRSRKKTRQPAPPIQQVLTLDETTGESEPAIGFSGRVDTIAEAAEESGDQAVAPESVSVEVDGQAVTTIVVDAPPSLADVDSDSEWADAPAAADDDDDDTPRSNDSADSAVSTRPLLNDPLSNPVSC